MHSYMKTCLGRGATCRIYGSMGRDRRPARYIDKDLWYNTSRHMASYWPILGAKCMALSSKRWNLSWRTRRQARSAGIFAGDTGIFAGRYRVFRSTLPYDTKRDQRMVERN